MLNVVQFVVAWYGILMFPILFTPFFPIYILLWLMCKHIPIPQNFIKEYQKYGKQNVSVAYVEELIPPCTREIIMIIPHGSFCIEAGVVISDFLSRFPSLKLTWLIDIKAYYAIPSAILAPRFFGVSKITYMKHRNIQKCMENNEVLLVLPGGFVEGVGGSEDTQYLYTYTYSYWLKQCQTHNYKLRLLHIYNGSSMFPQVEWNLEERMRIACRYHIPLSLFFVRSIDNFLVREIYYNNLPENTQSIERDIVHYIEIDKERRDLLTHNKTKYVIKSHF